MSDVGLEFAARLGPIEMNPVFLLSFPSGSSDSAFVDSRPGLRGERPLFETDNVCRMRRRLAPSPLRLL